MAIRIPVPQTVETQRVPGFFTAPGVVTTTNPGAVQTARLGQALQRSGADIARAATDLKDRLDFTGAKRGQALANEYLTDAVREFEKLEGAKASPEVLRGIWERVSTKVAEIGTGLENEVQTGLYTDAMQARMFTARRAMEGHLEDQSRVATIGATEADLAGKQDSMFDAGMQAARTQGTDAGPSFEESWRREVDSVEAEAEVLADLFGWEKTRTDLFVQQKLTETHAKVIEKLVDEGQTQKARGYLEAAGDGISAQNRAALESQIDRAAQREEAESTVSLIREELDEGYATREGADPEDTEMPAAQLLTDGLAALDEWRSTNLVSPQQAWMAEQELRRVAQDRRRGELDRREAVREEFEKAMRDDYTLTYDTLEPSLKRRVERNGLINDARNYQGSRGRYGTNKELLYDIYEGTHPALQSRSRREFDNAITGFLNPEERNEALAIWDSMHQAPKMTSAGGWMMHVREAARAEGILGRGLPGEVDSMLEKSEAFYTFRNMLTQELNAFEVNENQGKKATDTQMQMVINRVLKGQAYLDKPFNLFAPLAGDPLVRVALATPGQQERLYVNREQVISAFRTFLPNEPVPEALRMIDEPLYVRDLSEADRRQAETDLLEARLPRTEINIRMMHMVMQAEREAEAEAQRQEGFRRLREEVAPLQQPLPAQFRGGGR